MKKTSQFSYYTVFAATVKTEDTFGAFTEKNTNTNTNAYKPPIGIFQNVLTDDVYGKFSSNGLFAQAPITETQAVEGTYKPETKVSLTKIKWELQDYTGFAIGELDVWKKMARKVVLNKSDISETDEVFEMIRNFLIEQRWSETFVKIAFNSLQLANTAAFDAAFPGNTFLPYEKEILRKQNGFFKLIKNAVAAGTIPNVDNSARKGTALTPEQAYDMVQSTVRNARGKLRSLINSTTGSVQNSPVIFVSPSVFVGYREYFQNKGTASDLIWHGYNADGDPTMTKRMYLYDTMMLLPLSAAVDDFNEKAMPFVTEAQQTTALNQHIVIVADREALAVGMDQSTDGKTPSEIAFEMGSMRDGFLPKIQGSYAFQPIILHSELISVAGFQ